MNTIEENDNTDEKQIVVECNKHQVLATLKKYLVLGYTFVSQFSRESGSSEHIIILQKPDDRKTGRKNS